MRRAIALVLLATLSAIPVQSAFASPLPELIAQEGNANTRSGGDTDAELRAYLDKEIQNLKAEVAAMRKEMEAMHKEMDGMKAEIVKLEKEYPPNRKS